MPESPKKSRNLFIFSSENLPNLQTSNTNQILRNMANAEVSLKPDMFNFYHSSCNHINMKI